MLVTMPRRHPLREADPDTGEQQLALLDPTVARAEVASQTKLILRSAEAMRRLVLVDTAYTKKTELKSFPDGKADPMIQLTLIARDEWLAAEDGRYKVAYFKAMMDLFIRADEKVAAGMHSISDALAKEADRRQRDRHHRDRLELEREKRNGDPTEAGLLRIAEGGE